MNTIASKQTEVKYLKTGKRGPLPYPAGEWTAEATYTATENVAPYVLRNGVYYVMNKPGSVKGLDPQTDYATNGQQATWIPFEEYKAVYVELLMARLGLIGKSVFWDNYTFSQKGVDPQGQPSDQYQNFEAGTFTPNILIDWVEGTIRLLKLVAEGADVSGVINAVSGFIGKAVIGDYSLTYQDEDYLTKIGRNVGISWGMMGTNLYLENKNEDNKAVVVIHAYPYKGSMSSLEDPRSFAQAIDIEEGTLRVAPGNLVDIPGVLLAGTVNGAGDRIFGIGKERLANPSGYGRISFLSSRSGDNNNYEFIIAHNIGHTSYAVIVTPYITSSWRKVHPIITYQDANSFRVRLVDSGTNNDGEAYNFMFVVVGEND